MSQKDQIGITSGQGCEIAPTATFGNNVTLGDRVRVGAHTVVLDNVTVEDDCFLGAQCVVGEPAMAFYQDADAYEARPTVIGRGSIIRSGTIISEDVRLGEEFQSGAAVSIREGARFGRCCSVGTHSDIQPRVEIGNYVRLHSGVHLTACARVGSFVWMMPGCMFTDDNAFPVDPEPQPPQIGAYCVLGARSFFYPGVKLGRHVVVAANSKVKGTHEDFAFLHGDPARRLCDAREFFIDLGDRFFKPYPWPKHVDRNYPWRDVPPDERNLDDYE